jgi:hypothetical protein
MESDHFHHLDPLFNEWLEKIGSIKEAARTDPTTATASLLLIAGVEKWGRGKREAFQSYSRGWDHENEDKDASKKRKLGEGDEKKDA